MLGTIDFAIAKPHPLNRTEISPPFSVLPARFARHSLNLGHPENHVFGVVFSGSFSSDQGTRSGRLIGQREYERTDQL